MFCSPAIAQSASIQLDNTRASLISEYQAVIPGKPFRMAVLLEHRDGWHSYWQNPGEAGIPTELTWSLPDGYSASSIDWPPPELLREGPLVVYAYHGKILLPVTITPPDALGKSGSFTAKVKASWLVCKDICIPESAELETTLSIASEAAASESTELFKEHDANKPKHFSEKGAYSINGNHIALFFPRFALGTEQIENAVFFPINQNVIDYAAAQNFSVSNDTLTVTVSKTDEVPTGDIGGLLLLENNNGKKYFDVTLTPSAETPLLKKSDADAVIRSDPGFFLMLLFAVIGGAILNLMPCVLPVLSLKALAVVKKAGHEHAHVLRLGISYTAGILISFAVIAGILISLQQAGQAVGWGFQMQSPAFVGFLIYLLFMVGLNLSGLFNLPVLFGNVGSQIANESSLKGSFFTGVLATAVATPCTAPFMASAVGVALTLPALQAMSIFLALGFGLALPFLFICIFPQMLRFLPKPGAWMEKFKKLLAVPMYVSVVWLLWVLMLQTGMNGLLLALACLVCIVFLVRMNNHKLAIAILAALIAISLPMLSRIDDGSGMMAPASHDMEVIPYSKSALDELRNAHKPVFVDATAAWCITCQVNAKVAIHTTRTMQAFKDKNVTLMIADWTKQNAEISEFLKSFGYQGVPLYVYYPVGGEPVVLPQLLTEDIVISTITKE